MTIGINLRITLKLSIFGKSMFLAYSVNLFILMGSMYKYQSAAQAWSSRKKPARYRCQQVCNNPPRSGL